jgi:hypothetical protein
MFIVVLMAISQASAGCVICIAESGHIQIEYADSACCNPTIPPQGQADVLVEVEAPDCAACVDYELASHSLLRRTGHAILNYSTPPNTISGQFLATVIAGTTPISFCDRVIPNKTQRVHLVIEDSSSPLRC